jgi:hypothetical protein
MGILYWRSDYMAYPGAYKPIPGYRFQVFARNRADGRAWRSIAYAINKKRLYQQMESYAAKYAGYQFKVVRLPIKYWPISKR